MCCCVKKICIIIIVFIKYIVLQKTFCVSLVVVPIKQDSSSIVL